MKKSNERGQASFQKKPYQTVTLAEFIMDVGWQAASTVPPTRKALAPKRTRRIAKELANAR